MPTEVRELLEEIATLCDCDDLTRATVALMPTPRYSPAYNPAESLIHRVRQDALYHLPLAFTVQEKADRIRQHLVRGPPLTPAEMQNLLQHIYQLPHGDKAENCRNW